MASSTIATRLLSAHTQQPSRENNCRQIEIAMMTIFNLTLDAASCTLPCIEENDGDPSSITPAFHKGVITRREGLNLVPKQGQASEKFLKWGLQSECRGITKIRHPPDPTLALSLTSSAALHRCCCEVLLFGLLVNWQAAAWNREGKATDKS